VNQTGNVFEGPALDLRVDAFEGFFDQARYQLLSNERAWPGRPHRFCGRVPRRGAQRDLHHLQA
jgi:hypothetical protein